MRSSSVIIACLLFLLAIPAIAQEIDNKWEEAEKQIKRLSPDEYPGLPDNIVRAIKSRRGMIPQTADKPDPHNVIRGEFTRPGQQDWVVLCSVDGVSSILIFWAGSDSGVADLYPCEDIDCLQGLGDDIIGYSRYLAPVGEKYILDHYRAYGGQKPPPIDHQGIEDGFMYKGSVIHYYFEGQWLELAGAD
ncbi:MAG: hypothetical protein NTW14_11740 [bacterium]|nr:hypothetical protein [bacterium]